MIRLNDNILSLNHALAKRTNLQAGLARMAHFQILQVLREQDKTSRGYILIDELAGKNVNTTGFESFLRSIFPSRVSPSVLAAYFLQNVNAHSFTSIQEFKTFNFRDFQEFLALEFRASSLKKEIIDQAQKYIAFEQNGIDLKQFETYVATQQLPINCLLVFEYLSSGSKCIETRQEVSREIENQKKPEMRLGQKVEKMESLLNRLQTRVKQFGNEWLIEND